MQDPLRKARMLARGTLENIRAKHFVALWLMANPKNVLTILL